MMVISCRRAVSVAIFVMAWAADVRAQAPSLVWEKPLVHPNVSALDGREAGGACIAGGVLQAPVSGSPHPAWDAVLDCYGSDGSLTWSMEGVNPRDAFANAVAVGSDGATYVAGSFAAELQMGGASLIADTFEVADPPTPDLRFQTAEPFFLAAVEPSGQLRWLMKPFAADYQSNLWQLSVDDTHIYAAGYTRGMLHLTESTVVPPDHVFLARYKPDGSVEWGKPIAHFPSTLDPVQPRGLASDSSGGVWLLIRATDSTEVGGSAPPTNGPFDGLLLLHVGPDGTLRVQVPINADPLGAAALAVGEEGEVYVTGTYVDTLWLDEETWLPPALQENRTRVPRRFFLARYESDGRLAWARHATDERWSVVFSEGVAVTVNNAGDLQVAVRFRGEMVLDGDTLSSLSRSSLQVAGYSRQGDRQYGLVLSGASDGESASLATNAHGDLFVAYNGTLRRYRIDEAASSEGPEPHRSSLRLEQFPDPATEHLQVQFTLPSHAHTRLKVYDLLGRQRLLALDRALAPGVHRLSIQVSQLAAGRYVYRLEAGALSAVGSFIVAR